jgi:alanyl-tRNA synthetase
MQSENTTLKKELPSLNKLKAKVLKNELIEELKTFSEINFIAKELDLDAQGMKALSFEMGDQLDKAILIFGSRKTGKPLLSCYISKSLVAEQGKDAVEVIRELGKYINGGGGGQAFFSTAGGKNLNGITEAIKAAESICFK